LIWFFASTYPAQKPTEYCGQMADPFFLKIADALENGEFKNINPDEMKTCLKNRVLSDIFNRILEIKEE